MNLTIDRRSKTPLYQQIEIELRLSMMRGILLQGTILPSAHDFASELGVEENDVLLAYQALAKANHLIQKQQGWSVNYGKISQLIFRDFMSLHDIIQLSGSTPSISTLALKKDHKITKDIGIKIPFSEILYTRRLYFGNDIPQVLMDCYFAQDLFPDFEEVLETNTPYYELFETKYHIEVSRSERTLEAGNLRKKEAELLNVPTGSAYCYSIVKTFDHLERLIEVDVCWILPENLHFTIEQDE